MSEIEGLGVSSREEIGSAVGEEGMGERETISPTKPFNLSVTDKAKTRISSGYFSFQNKATILKKQQA